MEAVTCGGKNKNSLNFKGEGRRERRERETTPLRKGVVKVETLLPNGHLTPKTA